MMLSSEMSSSINALIHAVDILSFKVVSLNYWYSHMLQNDYSLKIMRRRKIH